MPTMKLTLLPFSTPNYVIAEMPPQSRNEGMKEAPKWPLKEIDADTLSELCDIFRAEIFEKAGKQDPATMQARPFCGQR